MISQIAEWIVAEIYGGVKAAAKNQVGWDVEVGNKKIQVKSHAKDPTNKNRWTYLKYEGVADITDIVVVVFTSDFVIKEFYEISWKKAQHYINRKHKHLTIRWDNISKYKKDLSSLPRQDIIAMFS
jgi:hypothetical protein